MSTTLVYSDVILYDFTRFNEECVKHIINYYKNNYVEEWCGINDDIAMKKFLDSLPKKYSDVINGQVIETSNGGLKDFLKT